MATPIAPSTSRTTNPTAADAPDPEPGTDTRAPHFGHLSLFLMNSFACAVYPQPLHRTLAHTPQQGHWPGFLNRAKVPPHLSH